MNTHLKGLLLTISGVLIVSPDTLLIRLIAMDVFSTAAWRGLLQAVGLALVLVAFYRSRTREAFLAIGWVGVMLAVVFSLTSFAFITAVKYTSVANVLVILASTPFHAAILSRIFLGENVALHTWIAILIGLLGIAIIVSDGIRSGSMFGDLMALVSALMLAAKLTIVRSRRHINMIPAMVISGLMFSAIAVAIGGPPTVPDQTQLIWVLLMGFAVITPATALLTLGPRYLPAPEVGLIVLLETVLGPLWVWLVIGETPTKWALVGGAIVVATLVTHALVSMHAYRRQSQRL